MPCKLMFWGLFYEQNLALFWRHGPPLRRPKTTG